MKKFLGHYRLLLFNIILALYLSELLVVLFLPTETNRISGDLNYLRYEKAREIGMDFDRRSKYEVFVAEKKKIPNLSPSYNFTENYFERGIGSNEKFQDFVGAKLKSNNLIPLRGPINKKTISCNEDGKRRVINNDKNGFKNPNTIYQKKIRIFLVGDSFAEGLCYDEKEDVAAFLRNELKINTANYGVSGAGPLLSLAVIKEYTNYYQPDFVFYLYYEGDDMKDLKDERQTFLMKYLNNFKQDLINRKDEIDDFFIDYENLVYKILDELPKENPEIHSENNKKERIEFVKDFLELQNLRKVIFSKSFFGVKNNTVDKSLFTKVLREMELEISTWDGEFIFVYLPTWHRFNQKYSIASYLHKKKVENIIKSMDVTFIDMVKEFEKEEEPLNLFPFGLFGHYTLEGYQLVAKNILMYCKKYGCR